MRRKIHKISFGLVSALLVWGGAMTSCGSSKTDQSHGSGSDQALAEDKQKAPDFDLIDLQGKKLSLKSLQGKVVFLDFWATWCPPCVMSSPEVEKLYEDYKGKPVEVVSISIDDQAERVVRFVESHKLKNRVALAGRSGVDARYGVRGIPAFFVIDKEGYVTGGWEGYHPSFPEIWRKELDKLLKA